MMKKDLENYMQDGKYYTNYKGKTYELDPDIVIATRHDCVYEWYISKGVYGIYMPVVRNTDVRGKILCGANLPLHLVGFAKKGIIINIKNDTDKPFEELTPEDIDDCFHQVQVYEIKRTKLDLKDENALKEAVKGE